MSRTATGSGAAEGGFLPRQGSCIALTSRSLLASTTGGHRPDPSDGKAAALNHSEQNAQGVKPWAFSLPASSVPCDLFLRDADLLPDPLGHRQILLQGRELLLDQVPYLR